MGRVWLLVEGRARQSWGQPVTAHSFSQLPSLPSPSTLPLLPLEAAVAHFNLILIFIFVVSFILLINIMQHRGDEGEVELSDVVALTIHNWRVLLYPLY